MLALLHILYFQISGSSVLEINSEILTKTFIIFSISTISKSASEYGHPKTLVYQKLEKMALVVARFSLF